MPMYEFKNCVLCGAFFRDPSGGGRDCCEACLASLRYTERAISELFREHPESPRATASIARAVHADEKYVRKLIEDGRVELKIIVAGDDAKRRRRLDVRKEVFEDRRRKYRQHRKC